MTNFKDFCDKIRAQKKLKRLSSFAPKRKHEEGDEEEDQGDQCNICTENIKKGKESFFENCIHGSNSHDKCAIRWIATQKTCPMCRAAVDYPTFFRRYTAKLKREEERRLEEIEEQRQAEIERRKAEIESIRANIALIQTKLPHRRPGSGTPALNETDRELTTELNRLQQELRRLHNPEEEFRREEQRRRQRQDAELRQADEEEAERRQAAGRRQADEADEAEADEADEAEADNQDTYDYFDGHHGHGQGHNDGYYYYED